MLTQDQIDHYHDQGYVLVGGIFDDDELDRLYTEANWARSSRMYAGLFSIVDALRAS